MTYSGHLYFLASEPYSGPPTTITTSPRMIPATSITPFSLAGIENCHLSVNRGVR